jgi:GGDEF domain-containing protein
MDRRRLSAIKDYLQRREVQERIQQKITEVRAKATVTISRAAELSGFSENQLRDWEKRGLFSAERASKQDGKGSPHRQYTPTDLEKLAVLHELHNQGYSIGELLREAEVIWQLASNRVQVKGDQANVGSLPIDQRGQRIYDETSFFPYFAAQVLKLSLSLIAEDIAEARVGMILPYARNTALSSIKRPEDVSMLGESLVGWYGRSHWFYTFLTAAPSFEYPSDFRVESLSVTQENGSGGNEPNDRTVVIVPRTARSLTLSRSAVETIQRLLAILYEDAQSWGDYFGEGMREVVYPAADFTSSRYMADPLLIGLANMVVRLGGKATDNRDRWRFCCILLARDSSLPLQQRSLVVRAQSKGAPHAVATTTVTSENPGLSLRAYLSGHVIYLPEISASDPIIAYRSEEEQSEAEAIRSAIAIPISGEDSLSVAVIYIVSSEANAFPKQDQRLLRMIGRMAEELLLTYNVRQPTSKLTDVLANPEIVDTAFKDFLSESDFIRDVEALLSKLKGEMEEWKEPIREEPLPLPERARRFWEEQKSGKVVSLIAIDISNQSVRSYKYGEQVARNLTKEVGMRIRKELDLLEKYKGRKLYHVSADQFYLLLDGILLEEAQVTAERLRQVLKGNYSFPIRIPDIKQPMLPDNMLELNDVTMRIGVSAYTYIKLQEVLKRYPFEVAILEVRKVIVDSLYGRLALGRIEGDDVIICWDPDRWDHVSLTEGV